LACLGVGGRARQTVIETPRSCWVAGVSLQPLQGRGRIRGGTPGKPPVQQPWKGRSPGEQPAEANASCGGTARGLSQGPKPRSRGRLCSVRRVHLGAASSTVNGMWVRRRQKRLPHPVGGESSEGLESQERCRHETRPTRTWGEQTAKRVTKPCRRNEAGQASPCQTWTPWFGRC